VKTIENQLFLYKVIEKQITTYKSEDQCLFIGIWRTISTRADTKSRSNRRYTDTKRPLHLLEWILHKL